MENTKEIVWGLTKDSSLLKAIAIVADKAERFGKGSHSVEYWAEELLGRGINTFDNYLDADKERRDKEAYLLAERKITLPDPTKPEDMVRYANEIMALRRRHGIGGEKKAL